MAFVTTVPEALAAASAKLEGLGSALAAQNAAAAASTTGVIPAAADQVSALQATQFSTYGTLYQQISADAQAIHQAFTNALGLSGTSYSAAEATNQSAAGTGGLTGLLNQLGAFFGQTGPTGLSGNLANIGNIGFGNWAAGSSDLLGLAGGGLLDAPADAAADAGGLGAGLASTTTPVGLAGAAAPAIGAGGLGGMPVLAGMGGASTAGGLSVPASWAAGGAPGGEHTRNTGGPGLDHRRAGPGSAPVSPCRPVCRRLLLPARVAWASGAALRRQAQGDAQAHRHLGIQATAPAGEQRNLITGSNGQD